MPEMYQPGPEDFKRAESVITDGQREMSNEQKEKEENLNTIRNEVDTTGDRLGHPIDSGIKETVVFLKALDIPTSGSCEGHLEWGVREPYVDIAAPGKPEEQWENQNATFEHIAKINNISVEGLLHGNPEELWRQAMNIASKNTEIDDYKEWAKKTEKLDQKVIDLLDEFYKDRDVEEAYRIKARGDEGIRLEFSDEETILKIINEELSDEEEIELVMKLPKRQQEMKEFTKFLEKKYWAV